MLTAVKRFVDRRSPAQVIAMGLALTALVGTLDYLTGYELSFAVFYLVPIIFVTWNTRRAGYFFCGLSTFVWFAVDSTSAHPYSNGLIPIWNAGTRLGFFLVTSYLLQELKAHLKSEQLLARVDGLTGVLNARAFMDASRGLLALAARHGHPAALGYIDLDNFKAINDASGHSEGDRVLQAVAKALTGAARETDVVGRMGGDEFAIFLPETNLAGARIVFDRIREDVAQDAGRGGQSIGFSIGVAVFPTAPSTVDEALKIADRLMYRVKSAGKNNVVYEEQPKADDQLA